MIPKSVLLLGCHGSGMRGLAELLCDLGVLPSGMDDTESPNKYVNYLGPVRQIPQLQSYDLICFSGAFSPNHPLLASVRENGGILLHRFDLLLKIAEGRQIILVTGSHGKSSVAGMISYVLRSHEPASYYLGAKILDDQRYAKFDKGDFFVIEADESDGSFLKAKPFLSVVTSIDYEHMEFWRSIKCLEWSFYSLSLVSRKILSNTFFTIKCDFRSYHSKAQIKRINLLKEGTFFEFTLDGKSYEGFIPFHGNQYAQNALISVLALQELSINPNLALERLKSYPGLSRRLEKINLNPLVISDYAHHPAEVKVVIESLKELFKDLVVFYQPHRLSRLILTLSLYKNLFSNLKVFILPVFEPGIGEINNEIVHDLVNISGAQFIQNFEIEFEKALSRSEVILLLGAGDIDERARKILKGFNKQVS